MSKQPEDLVLWLKDNLFNAIPTAIGIIDRDYNIVHANPSFEKVFGAWQDRKCYQVYRGRDAKCDYCGSEAAFEHGNPITREEVGYKKNGKSGGGIMRITPAPNLTFLDNIDLEDIPSHIFIR